MQTWPVRISARALCAVELALCAVACGGSDGEPARQVGVIDAAVIAGGGAAAIDAATPSGADASPLPASDAGSAMSSTRDAQTEAGPEARTDAGSSTREAGTAPNDAGSGAGSPEAGGALEKFSFFVSSLGAMRMLAGSQNGFGGDLRHGETGEGAGLRGADKICAQIAELSMPGAAAKQWRAFLSTTTVHARTRIGEGPWYDRKGRLISQNLAGLMSERPQGAPMEIRDDLPNERGEPNRAGSAEGGRDDNHDVITASDARGMYDGSNTCADWTSTTATVMGGSAMGGLAGPRIGHSWPAGSGRGWAAAHNAPGCAPSVNLTQGGGGGPANGIGNLGGYGAIYCFALMP